MDDTLLRTDPRRAAVEAFASIDAGAIADARAARPGWTPFAPAVDRTVWDAIDPLTRTHVIARAHEAVDSEWPRLRASDWLAFGRIGDRRAYENGYFQRRRQLTALALALALEPDGPWLDALVDGVWSVLEETSWCVPAHDNSTHRPECQREPREFADPAAPTLDLFAAETAATLSFIAALHRHRAESDPVLAELFARIAREVDVRVLHPFESETRSYHWFGIPSNWNPWIVSNVLASALVQEVGRARWERIASLARASLLAYREGALDDGGCAEGIMYWWQSAARYFEALELLTAFDAGARSAAMSDPVLARMARYPMVVHLGGPWSANFGDGGARVPRPERGPVKDRLPYGLLHRFARAVGDAELASFARARRDDGPLIELPVALTRAIGIVNDEHWGSATASEETLPAAHYLERLQVLATRERPGLSRGLTLVVKGGHNDEPHNHNDVGSFIVASDGVPVIIDAGTGTYTKQSFGPERYEAWFTRSGFHNTPAPGGHEQVAAATSRARDVVFEHEDEQTVLSMELVDAYPPSALRSWRRVAALARREGAVIIEDRWLAHEPIRAAVNLLLAGVLERSDGRLLAGAPEGEAADPLAITIEDEHGASVPMEFETIHIDDRQLTSVWGPSIVRVSAGPLRPASEGRLRTVIRQA